MHWASNARKAGIGIMLESSEGIKLECSLRMGFSSSHKAGCHGVGGLFEFAVGGEPS